MRGTYFCLDKNNFHKVANNLKGFLNRLNSGVEQSEYEPSDFYRKISKKLLYCWWNARSSILLGK